MMRFFNLILPIFIITRSDFAVADEPQTSSSFATQPDLCSDPDHCNDAVGSFRHKKTCRGNRRLKPHHQGLWEDGFPSTTTDLIVPMCEGEISVSANGELCVDGRVTYGQITQYVQKESPGSLYTKTHSVYRPSADSISITGHLTTGSGNFLNGNKAVPLYDFVNSYIINGTNYTSDRTMIDKLLGASQGTIDGVCFDPSFVRAETYYETSHKGWGPSSVNIDDFSTASLIFASSTWVVAEYHTVLDAVPSLIERFIGRSRFASFLATISFPTPSLAYDFVPIFAFSGILRQIIIGKSKISTADVPNPLEAPTLFVENTQMDVSWSDLLLVVKAGIFSQFPSKMSAIIKKITPKEGTFGCWTVPVASVDLQMPAGYGQDLDDFINNVFYPKLLELNNTAEVTFSFGKRLPIGSVALQSALNKYASCGASLKPTVEKCYHPMCSRTVIPSSFEYPEKYYEKKRERLL